MKNGAAPQKVGRHCYTSLELPQNDFCSSPRGDAVPLRNCDKQNITLLIVEFMDQGVDRFRIVIVVYPHL